MSAHTKARLTEKTKVRKVRIPTSLASAKSIVEEGTPWRDLFRDLLDKQTEQGLYLSGLRCRESMTQKQLAGYLKVGQAQISRMERGMRPISEEMAHRLEVLFKVPYKSFMTKANRLAKLL